MERDLDGHFMNEDTLEWTGIGLRTSLNGASMMKCMRQWPDSKEGNCIFF
jgi:hypothetical protein